MALLDESLDADDLTACYADSHDKILTAISAERIRRLNPAIPLTLEPRHTVADAIQLMQSRHIGAVVIVEDQRPVGMFTERDVLTKVVGRIQDLKAVRLQELMTARPICLRSEDKIAYALNQMTIGGFRHIPLVDAEGQLTGIISVRDIADFLADLVPAEVYNLRPEPLRGGFQGADGG